MTFFFFFILDLFIFKFLSRQCLSLTRQINSYWIYRKALKRLNIYYNFSSSHKPQICLPSNWIGSSSIVCLLYLIERYHFSSIHSAETFSNISFSELTLFPLPFQLLILWAKKNRRTKKIKKNHQLLENPTFSLIGQSWEAYCVGPCVSYPLCTSMSFFFCYFILFLYFSFLVFCLWTAVDPRDNLLRTTDKNIGLSRTERQLQYYFSKTKKICVRSCEHWGLNFQSYPLYCLPFVIFNTNSRLKYTFNFYLISNKIN